MNRASQGRGGWLRVIGPGLLVAATGVGAGDLAAASLAGSKVGLSVLWAVVVGAFLKWMVNEGLARWQLATGTTFLEGAVERFGLVAVVVFLPYLTVWSFFVATALMGACGVTAHAAIPLFESAATAKIVFGIVHSLLGLALVFLGGFALFEKTMSVFIGVMFVVVVATAALLVPDAGALVRGAVVPDPATLRAPNLSWTVALMGGVGGSVTVLCYGYWIREKGRNSIDHLAVCRIDLAVGYTVTAIFGLAMVVIGSTVEISGGGATLVVDLAQRLEGPVGPVGRWAFLVGAWGAVFSSLLGVWQAVPYLFADFCRRAFVDRNRSGGEARAERPLEETRPYRGFLFFLATVPALGLTVSFAEMQKLYAILSAAVIPLLALALLVMNSRRDWVGGKARNGPVVVIVLVFALAFFGWLLVRKVLSE